MFSVCVRTDTQSAFVLSHLSETILTARSRMHGDDLNTPVKRKLARARIKSNIKRQLTASAQTAPVVGFLAELKILITLIPNAALIYDVN